MSSFKRTLTGLPLRIFGRDPQHLWRRYAFAVIFVVLSLFFSNLAPKASLTAVEGNAEIIHVAGRQGALSQKIFYLTELVSVETTINEKTHGYLRSTISEFEDTQKRLSLIRQQRLEKKPNEEFSKLNQKLDRDVAAFITSARGFEDSVPGLSNSIKPSNNLRVWPDRLFEELDAAAKQDEIYVLGKVRHANLIANAALILALLILILEALFIFLPGHRLIIKFLEDREKNEAKITAQNEEMQQFTYTASHDLRGPLRAMENLTKFMEEDILEENFSEVPVQMTLLRSRISRMNNLLSDMLAFSKIGKGRLELSTFDMGEALHEVVGWIDVPDGFTIKLDPALPTVTASISAVQQVFLNLLNNAVKHHDKDVGHIEVKYRDAGDNHIFIVSDDGPGIPEEYREYIFKPFTRLETRDKVEGSGIGLAITKKFLAAGKATLTVLDTGQPRGTSFQITQPKKPFG